MRYPRFLFVLVLVFTLTASVAGSLNSSPQPNIGLALGNPSDATDDPSNADNFLMVKKQYVLSFNNSKGGPNWVAWHLQASDIGSFARGDFKVDNTLPSGFKHIKKADYNNSGFDRGHICNSKDRTNSRANNDATFLMTNILPQRPDNNQGPWVRLETFERSLAIAGNELYIYAGAFGENATIAGGKVNVPKTFWKVMVVLPRGNNDLSRINADTRAIAVCMPNRQGIRNRNWRTFVTSIRNVEAATGYDFLSPLSASIEDAIETQTDSEGTGTGNPCQ